VVALYFPEISATSENGTWKVNLD